MLISMPTSFFSGRSNKNDQIHEGDNPIEQLTNNWYKIPFIPEQNRSHTLYRLLFRLNSNFMFCISLTTRAKNYNSLKQDSLCLPRDPALTTRGLLEEGEYSPRDLLILDSQGHVLSKADPFHSKADKAPVEVEENVLVDSWKDFYLKVGVTYKLPKFWKHICASVNSIIFILYHIYFSLFWFHCKVKLGFLGVSKIKRSKYVVKHLFSTLIFTSICNPP